MKRKKILVCLLLVFGWVLAGKSGLLDLIPVPRGFSLPSLGRMIFPGDGGHAFINLEAGLIDLTVYSLLLYAFVSVSFRLFGNIRQK